MWSEIRLRIGNNQSFMGPGAVDLLESIKRSSSIKIATKETGISYQKALRMLRRMEQELGFPVVISKKGGSERGGTVLTEKGDLVLQSYKKIVKEVSAFAEEKVKECFPIQ